MDERRYLVTRDKPLELVPIDLGGPLEVGMFNADADRGRARNRSKGLRRTENPYSGGLRM